MRRIQVISQGPLDLSDDPQPDEPQTDLLHLPDVCQADESEGPGPDAILPAPAQCPLPSPEMPEQRQSAERNCGPSQRKLHGNNRRGQAGVSPYTPLCGHDRVALTEGDANAGRCTWLHSPQALRCDFREGPRSHLTGVSPGSFQAFSAATTMNRMPARTPCAERSRPAIPTSRLGHRPGPPSDPPLDHTQAGLAILRLLHPDCSTRPGPLRAGCSPRPAQYLPGIPRNCPSHLNPRGIHPHPPGPVRNRRAGFTPRRASARLCRRALPVKTDTAC